MASDIALDSETATVETGTTMNWTNTSDVGHMVTAYEDEIPDGATYFTSGSFESEQAARNRASDGIVAPDEEYRHTFEQSRAYEYFCILHESSGIVGTVRAELS